VATISSKCVSFARNTLKFTNYTSPLGLSSMKLEKHIESFGIRWWRFME